MSAEIEKIKTELILKPLNSKEELRDWMYTFFGLKFPMGVVYPTSTHGPIDAAWRIYELMKTGQSQDVPEVVLLSSRDSYKTLIASAIEVLCLIHFEISIAHAAAILSQSEKAVSYANSFFNKISPYLKNNGWEKTSDNKTKIEWRTSKGDTIYLRVLVMTRKGMNCVLGSTKIRTDQGALSASDIYKQICEGVKFRFLSFNHGTSQLEYKNIVCTEKTKQTDTYTVETSKGTVQVSGDHKIYVEGVGYVKAKDVKEGDVILRAKGDRSYLHSNHGKRNDIKNIKEQLKSFTNIKLLSDKYKNNTTPMSFSCSDHGVFERKWCKIQDRIQKSLNPCPSCNRKQGVENQRLTKQQITDQIQETDFKLIDIKYYQTSRDSKLELECSKGHVFEINHNNFLTNVRCTKCSSVSSKSQNEIYEYVKSIYNKQVVLNDRKAIAPLELDIYIPEKNFGIEFDGLYWHSEKVKSDIKQNNISKIQKITEKNTSLLAIYEDEWANLVKQELIKAMIRNRLGIKPLYTKRASKLFVKKLTKNKDFKHFFDTYHLDGHVNASFAYGLFDGEKMVSCMSFRKSFSDKEWEIARFATDYNYKVHGNAGKLVAQFKKEYNAKLVTYSNNRLSHGDVYEKLGFKDITKTMSPSYYYTDFVTRLWRFKCKKINDPEILREFPTEKQQAEGGVFSKKYLGHNKPLYRIYDYGHKKWIKE